MELDEEKQELRSLATCAGRTGEARGAGGTERLNAVSRDMRQHAPNNRLGQDDNPEPWRSMSQR